MATPSKRIKIPDEYKQGEDPGLNRHWQQRFLDYLAESSNVKKSAERAGANPCTVKKRHNTERRKEKEKKHT